MARIKMLGLVVMAVMLLPFTAPAQPPDTLWTKIYGGSDSEEGFSVAQTNDGGFIIAGSITYYGTGGKDVYLIKTDTNGDTLWTKTYGGNYWNEGNSVAQTSDGGYIITGWTGSIGNYSIYLIKTDANGDTLWTKIYAHSDYDWGYSVAQTTDGGYIIAGNTWSYESLSDVYLIKTDANGDSLWTKTYGSSGDEVGYSVVQTRDGGYIIAGVTMPHGINNSGNIYLIKTIFNGDTLWTNTYGGVWKYDDGHSVAQTSDGGYIITGATGSYGAGNYDVYLIKTGFNLDTIWTKTYGGSEGDLGFSVQQTADDGYIIAGMTNSYGAGKDDVYLIKTDANGDSLWTKTYGSSGDEVGYSVVQTRDGGYIIAGTTQSYGQGTPDYSNIYLIRLGPETRVEENSNLTAENPNLHLNQNPFSTSTTISFQIPTRSKVSLSVFDVTGREIKRLVDAVQEQGDYRFRLDMTGYAEGIYFIRLETNGYQATQKIVRVR